MHRFNIVTLTDDIVARGKITAQDVLTLRQSVFGDGHVWPDEAVAMFDLMQKRLPACAEWPAFFIEAMTDYIVNQTDPHGHVDTANARWLIAMISRDKEVWSDTELELLINVMDKAKSSPDFLEAFILKAVCDAVTSGKGPTRRGMNLQAGSIGAGEVDILRRVLYAAGGPGHLAITRTEAEALFDINDATLKGQNDPSWRDLFVKAIASHVMTISGYQPPSREEALRREKWLDDANTNVAGFFGRMMSGWRDAFAAHTPPQEQRLADVLAREAEHVSEVEAQWLHERILRNGQVCENQKALLAFLKAESPQIHPVLRDLFAKAA